MVALALLSTLFVVGAAIQGSWSVVLIDLVPLVGSVLIWRALRPLPAG